MENSRFLSHELLLLCSCETEIQMPIATDGTAKASIERNYVIVIYHKIFRGDVFISYIAITTIKQLVHPVYSNTITITPFV